MSPFPQTWLSMRIAPLELANSPYEGIGYDEKAAQRSWTAMLNLFSELVGNVDIYTRH